jgi:hypothetical protein
LDAVERPKSGDFLGDKMERYQKNGAYGKDPNDRTNNAGEKSSAGLDGYACSCRHKNHGEGCIFYKRDALVAAIQTAIQTLPSYEEHEINGCYEDGAGIFDQT